MASVQKYDMRVTSVTRKGRPVTVLEPSTRHAAEKLEGLNGQVRVAITQPRNVSHNALYWVILGQVMDNAEFTTINTTEALHFNLKSIYAYDHRPDLLIEFSYGEVQFRAVSTSFDKMDQQEFKLYFDWAMDFLQNKVMRMGDADWALFMREAERGNTPRNNKLEAAA